MTMTQTSSPIASAATQGITLLPRHWDWLRAQPRSASATLRRLIDEARRDPQGVQRRALARDACYAHLRDAAGDRPGFEDAVRALYAGKPADFAHHTATWPSDVRLRAAALAAEAWPSGETS